MTRHNEREGLLIHILRYLQRRTQRRCVSHVHPHLGAAATLLDLRTLKLLPRSFWQHRTRQDSPKTAQRLTHMEGSEMDTENADHVVVVVVDVVGVGVDGTTSSCASAPWNSSHGASGNTEHVKMRPRRRNGFPTWNVPRWKPKTRKRKAGIHRKISADSWNPGGVVCRSAGVDARFPVYRSSGSIHRSRSSRLWE